jgi:hypothetical protein
MKKPLTLINANSANYSQEESPPALIGENSRNSRKRLGLFFVYVAYFVVSNGSAQIPPATLSVMVNTNHVLVQPTNFFAANSNLLNAAVTGGGGGATNYVTNTIAPAQLFVGSANSNGVAKTLAKDGTLDTNGNLTLANNSTARGDLGLGTAATQTTGTFAQVANNGSDFLSLANTAINIGIYGLSSDPSNTVGGITGKYPQQIGIDSSGNFYVYSSGTNWNVPPNFIAGFNSVGSQFEMNPALTGFTKLYAAGSPSLQTSATVSSDYGYVVEGMNPYSRQVLGVNMVGTNVNGSAISTNSAGVKVYKQWDEAIEFTVENLQGTSNNIIGYGVIVSPGSTGQAFAWSGTPGGFSHSGNYSHWAWDGTNLFAGVPLWVDGVNNPGDSRWKWSFDVAPKTGVAFALGPLYTGTLSNQLTQPNGYLNYNGAFDPNETAAVNLQNAVVTATNYFSGLIGSGAIAYGMGGGGGNGLGTETQAHGVRADSLYAHGLRVVTATVASSQGDGGFISTGSIAIGDDTSLASSDTTGNATFQVFGSEARKVLSKSGNYTLTDADGVIIVTATGTTQTLPSGSSHCLGRFYTIMLNASGSCTIATTSSQNIIGTAGSATTYSLSAQGKHATVIWDGTQWEVIENN